MTPTFGTIEPPTSLYFSSRTAASISNALSPRRAAFLEIIGTDISLKAYETLRLPVVDGVPALAESIVSHLFPPPNAARTAPVPIENNEPFASAERSVVRLSKLVTVGLPADAGSTANPWLRLKAFTDVVTVTEPNHCFGRVKSNPVATPY